MVSLCVREGLERGRNIHQAEVVSSAQSALDFLSSGARGRVGRVLLWVGRALFALLFINAGLSKLTGTIWVARWD